MAFLGKNVQIFCPFYNHFFFFFFFFAIELYEFSLILDTSPLADIWFADIFSHLPFRFLNGFLCRAEAFLLDIVPLV